MKLQIVVPVEGATPFLEFFDTLDEKQRQKLMSLFAMLLQSPAAVMREPYARWSETRLLPLRRRVRPPHR